MRKFFVTLLVVVASLVLVTNGFSVQTVASPEKTKEQAITPEDAKKVREEVKKLGEIFGVKAEEKGEKKEGQKKEVTMASVADKALDLMTQSVATISAAIQKVAPEIWRIMIKQQYAKAIADLFRALFLF